MIGYWRTVFDESKETNEKNLFSRKKHCLTCLLRDVDIVSISFSGTFLVSQPGVHVLSRQCTSQSPLRFQSCVKETADDKKGSQAYFMVDENFTLKLVLK